MRVVSSVAVVMMTLPVTACSDGGAEPVAGLDGFKNSVWQASTMNGQTLPYSWQDLNLVSHDTSSWELIEFEMRMGANVGDPNRCIDAGIILGESYDAACCIAELRYRLNGGSDTTALEYCTVDMGPDEGFRVQWLWFTAPLPTAKQGEWEPVNRLTLERPADYCEYPQVCPALTLVLDRQ